MRELIVLMVMILSGHLAFAEGIVKGSESIQVNLDYASMQATVACVTEYSPHSEDEGSPELFFTKADENRKSKELQAKGYTPLKTLKEGWTCSEYDGNMTNVGVLSGDTRVRIKKVIIEKNAGVDATVIFIKDKQLFLDFTFAKLKIIDALLK